MGRMIRLAMMGVPVGGGGALRKLIEDDFSTLSPEWVRGDGAAADNLSVAGGVATITPTGTEINTSANAASDPNGNEANATTGWGVSNASLASIEDPYAGSYAIQVTATATSGYGRITWTGTVQTWDLISVYAKETTGSGSALIFWGAGAYLFTNAVIFASPTDTFARHVGSGLRSTGTSAGFLFRQALNNDVGVIDNVSVLELAIASQLVIRPLDYPISAIQVETTRTANTQIGVALVQDVNNFILAFDDGLGNVRLIKCVSGAYSALLGDGAITYGAGKVLSLTPNAAGTHFTVAYDGTDEISNVEITDFSFTGQWYAGLFTTFAGNTFDNLRAEKV